MAAQWEFPGGGFCEDTGRLSGPRGEVTLEPRVAALLAEFLRHPAEVLSADHLLAAVWRGRLVSDEAIRRAVSSLRNGLVEVGLGKPLRTVRKRGYLCELRAECSRAAPVSAPQSREGSPGRGRIPRYLPIVGLSLLLVLVLTLLLDDRAIREGSPVAQDYPVTLAVLPFANFVDDPASRAFSDGMAEELISLLGQFQDFRVTSRTSSFKFRGESVRVREVGRELGVRYLIEGSVKAEEGVVRVSAALVDTRDGFQLWSGSYERDELQGLLTVQWGIAKEVARALKVVLVDVREDPAELSPGRGLAQQEYWQAVELMQSWGMPELRQASAHLRRAIDLDPSFARAYVELANVLSMLASNDPIAEPNPHEMVRSLTDRALELDPDTGEAYIARAGTSPNDSLDAIEADLRKGIQLSPSSSRGYERLAEFEYINRGDIDAANRAIERAIALDPLRPRNYHMKAYFALWQCRFDEVVRLEQEALRVEPRFRAALANLAKVSAYRGDLAQAVDYLEQARALDIESPWLRELLLVAYLNIGDPDAAEALNDPPLVAGSLMLRAFHGDEVGLAKTFFASSPKDMQHMLPWHVSHFALRAAMATGDYRRALALASEALPGWRTLADFDESARSSVMLWPAYINLWLLQQYAEDRDVNGAELAGIRRTLRQIQDGDLACLPGGLIEAQALATYHSGDPRVATLGLVRAARDRRLLPSVWWMLRDNPVFAGLQAVPGFNSLITEGEALAELQRHLPREGQGERETARLPRRNHTGEFY